MMTKPIKLGIADLAGLVLVCTSRSLRAGRSCFRLSLVCDVIADRRNKAAEKYGCSYEA